MYKGYFQWGGQEHFWFRGRAELVDILCVEFLSQTKASKILDIGAGEGDLAIVLAQYGTVTALDVSKEALSKMPSCAQVTPTIGNAVDLPFLHHTFDTVCLFDVLEHITDDMRAIQEARRVLKPGGLLLITVPLHSWLFSAHDRANGHKRRYSTNGIRALLRDFTPLRLGYWNCTLLPIIACVRIIRRNVPPRFDDDELPEWLNKLFWKIIHRENQWIERLLHLPWGLTLFGIFQKPTK